MKDSIPEVSYSTLVCDVLQGNKTFLEYFDSSGITHCQESFCFTLVCIVYDLELSAFNLLHSVQPLFLKNNRTQAFLSSESMSGSYTVKVPRYSH